MRERRSAVAGDTQFTFQHVLLRDVAYGQIPRRARAEKHRRAAEWIEGLGRPDDNAELLAYHYKEALALARAAGVEDEPELVKRARESLLAAGDRAMSLSAYEASDGFFAEALELLPADDPARPALLLRRARALLPIGGQGLGLLEEAIPGFEQAGDVEGMAEALAISARFTWFMGDRAATDRYMAATLEALEDRPPSRSKAEALSHQSGFDMLAGRFEQSIRFGEEALPLATQFGMEEQRARLHIVIGTSRCCLGDAGGLDEIRAGIEIAESASNVDMMIAGYSNLSSELHFMARLRRRGVNGSTSSSSRSATRLTARCGAPSQERHRGPAWTGAGTRRSPWPNRSSRKPSAETATTPMPWSIRPARGSGSHAGTTPAPTGTAGRRLSGRAPRTRKPRLPRSRSARR